MRRIVVVLVALAGLAVPPGASAWTWPLGGDVLRPYTLGADPYAGGQHRGIDVSGSYGEPVRAPASGTVSYAGVVPGSGRTVTIQHEGYAVSLTHLGEISVSKGMTVVEGTRFQMSRTPAVVTRGGPTFGEHTFDVLTETLGYDSDRIAELAIAELLE